ncbi:MAG: hypothetical protein KAU62_13400 [Candidatus Heimdallarchaeota archaeon]|nr:hypothetical protein [Candidatus Heimdallarchaeota archaeon]MCG3257088.1 hypothetical protein [Candidatus Heimdallarchaeota archaeon]MCK4612148.1 hypothetical protein [Candidatus Heimdallarchaeota archaeon]
MIKGHSIGEGWKEHQIDTYDMDSYEELYLDLNRKANNPITYLSAIIVLITLVVFRRKIRSN